MIPLFKVFNDCEQASKNVGEVLASGYVGQGKWCENLEAGLRDLLGLQRILYVNSGTSAIQLALKLAGIGPGTEVISTPITCIATNAAISTLNASIVWADVDPITGNMDPKSALSRVNGRTRAIIAVDWAGRLCDFEGLRQATRGITLVEDAAHALLSKGFGRGDFICYSLQAIKFLNTADGGALSCPSAATHERAKLVRWFGLDRTRSDSMRCYQPIDEVGYKMQGNDVLAAIGCANLPHAAALVEKHRVNAALLHKALSPTPHIRLPPFDAGSSYWLFTILVSSPPRFEEFCKQRGIMVSQVHARNDIYGCFRQFQGAPLPGVDFFAAHQVSIPVGWWLSEGELAQVVQTVQDWASTKEARWSMEP